MKNFISQKLRYFDERVIQKRQVAQEKIDTAGVVAGSLSLSVLEGDLLIAYGTQSGNSADIAANIKKIATVCGFSVRCVPLNNVEVEQLTSFNEVLFIVSTYGDGDEPRSAHKFWEVIFDEKVKSLTGLDFSVCSLGDSRYEYFCQAGKDLDKRLAELGAHRIYPRADCDVQYESSAKNWVKGSLSVLLAKEDKDPAPLMASLSEFFGDVSTGLEEVKATAQFTGEEISGKGAESKVSHYVLRVKEDFPYKTGDAISLIPIGNDELADKLIAEINFTFDNPKFQQVDLLKEEIKTNYDITKITRILLEKVAASIGDLGLIEALSCDDRVGIQQWCYGRDVLDVIELSNVREWSVKDFLEVLAPQRERTYSISSSPLAFPNEVHLTVKAVRYQSEGRFRGGVCSTYLEDHLSKGALAEITLVTNEHFRLPSDNSLPIIMIGPGTGVAPFRAFLQERNKLSATGKNWLFFGARYRTKDFLYGNEFLDMEKSGFLTKLSAAFSRDTSHKIYVQDLIRENGEEFFSWLESGAIVYICGDSLSMAPAVEKAISDVIETFGKRDSNKYMSALREQGRLNLDVY
ncbi:MAG: diflavin oxidoreductase [Mycobacteriaceae bacterium]